MNALPQLVLPACLAICLALTPSELRPNTSATAPSGANGQSATGGEAPPRGSSLVVSIITVGQGDLVWEKFGHNGLRVRDTVLNTDVWFNWGLFNPAEKGFLLRFLQGRMRYSMAGEPVLPWLRMYASEDRNIWEQTLALSNEQKAQLYELARVNDTEANRYYDYNYYLDNCSTRVRDILDRVLGGQIRAATEAVPTGNTFRGHTRRLLADSPLSYFGIQLVLGHNADRPISRWEEMFLPLSMMSYLADVTIRGPDGELAPLVGPPRVLNSSPVRVEPQTMRPPTFSYLLAGVAVTVLLLLGSRAAARGSRAALSLFSSASIVWCVVAGLAGTLALAMWVFSEHTFMYRNETILLMNPLLLPLAFLLRATVARARRVRVVMALCGVVAGLSVVATILHLTGVGQENPEFVLLALGPNLALWLGTGMILSGRNFSRSPDYAH